MTPLHGIASFYDVGFGARAVSRKTPIYFMDLIQGCEKRQIWQIYLCYFFPAGANFWHMHARDTRNMMQVPVLSALATDALAPFYQHFFISFQNAAQRCYLKCYLAVSLLVASLTERQPF